MYFCYSFKELIDGKHPENHTWIVTKKNHNKLSQLGAIPKAIDWKLEEQENLIDIVAEANIRTIQKISQFPDWIGYIGLVLAYTEAAETNSNKLTRTLIPQFKRLINDSSVSYKSLESILIENRVLTWHDLETVETGIMKNE